MSMMHRRLRDQRGASMVLFAFFLPTILVLGAALVNIGNWWVHGKHLQTKVDASALAGGGVWAFPCGAPGSAIDANIEQVARDYVGPHIQADGSAYLTTSLNPQVGGTPGSKIHVVLNGSAWYDDDSNPAPIEQNDPPNASLCDARTLDVKATEDNSGPLFDWLPFFPDIKRKARVQIEEAEALGGLLPIAVRVPKPESAAAIFYNETPGPNYGAILDVKYFREDNTIFLPPAFAGLGGWTTEDISGGNWASFAMPDQAGVVIGLSFRPECPEPNGRPCFDLSAGTTVSQLCNQTTPGGVAIVQCFYATGNGSSQTVQSGLQFIRGYNFGTADNAPELESVWLDTPIGTNCGAYFGAPVVNSCDATLHANIDAGPATTQNTEVRYKLVAGNTSDADDDPPGPCGNNYQPACDLSPSWSTTVTLDPQYARHAIAIRVRVRFIPNPVSLGLPAACANNYNAGCQWFFTANGRTTNVPTDAQIFANPVQRAFMGDIDLSGPVKYLHMYADTDCDGGLDWGLGETGPAASIEKGGPRCFKMEMGLQGAIPDDQDVYPIGFNLSTTSQHQLLDCDPNIPQGQIDDAIVQGCEPLYEAHDFVQSPLCPQQNQFFDLPQPSPWQNWDPKTCVKTRPTASGNQIRMGLNGRIFGDKNNPTCPADVPFGDPAFQWGRNYWNDANNANDGDTTYTELGPGGAHVYAIPEGDPRLVTLFFTEYRSFGFNGQETFAVTGLGRFYISGYGRSGNIDDPCSGGDSSGIPGAGRLPPPDLIFGNNYYVWGHFVKDVVLTGSSIPSGVLCDPSSLTPCVAVLVE